MLHSWSPRVIAQAARLRQRAVQHRRGVKRAAVVDVRQPAAQIQVCGRSAEECGAKAVSGGGTSGPSQMDSIRTRHPQGLRPAQA